MNTFYEHLAATGVIHTTTMGNTYEITQRYYSVGPLQSDSLIERWYFSGDSYDTRRWSYGNVFPTREEAEKYRDKLIRISNEPNGNG